VSWLLSMSACALLADRPDVPPADALFPHPADYASHGEDAARVGEAACQVCHEASRPACVSCHDHPHPPGFAAGALHGLPLLKGADVAPCLDCHDDGPVTSSVAPCLGCHGSYPHDEGWSAAGQHGAYALARGGPRVVCGPCHGEDLDGGDAGSACTTCHAAYPHPEGFSAAHGAAAGDDCAACHGADWRGGISGVACSQCHAAYPHDDDFDHVFSAARSGEGTCLLCHDESAVSLPAASCAARCHGDSAP